ncbi:MAG: hypothetical protein QOE93_1951 [Actinomycetota bacterium]|nr:hypothetical protein [Actinomycetota bacterium]
MARIAVPIACTLEPDAVEDRVTEWHALLAARVDRVDRVERVEGDGPAAGRLRLRPGDDTLLAAVDLAQREKACCGFFRFSVELEADARWLRVEVPADAAAVLDDFLGAHPSEEDGPGRQ